jgi:hypothetical protein
LSDFGGNPLEKHVVWAIEDQDDRKATQGWGFRTSACVNR